ncbi:hypothetical protein KP509_10G043500 [Ceratopteris richardii]|uniref:Carbohydrate kinase PfkB domain-containing protein n=1 Tax=Ceratopteris richardii TaxID=49495 RepID=A0A8T2TYD6_CERRI|nr:hypothetical protein KP509_10G043500 [Ceratopteris richardii]KAH7427409.1 hypothetical protein KP509_10G043500 [Ceratopteris richardii]
MESYIMDDSVVEEQTSASEKPIVAGCGGVYMDYLATVARFPQPDEKIRSIDSKVSNDAFGKLVIEELNGDGVDTSFMVVSDIGTTPFTYVIVDREKNTRTCINSPGYPPLSPQELPDGIVTKILDGAKLLYLDGRLADTALLLAEEAKRKRIPILIDAEPKRAGLDELLQFADYVVCSAEFPQVWTGFPTFPGALTQIAIKLPNLKFVIVTLGASGCVMLERMSHCLSDLELFDVNTEYELLLKRSFQATGEPTAISSEVRLFKQTASNGETVEFPGRLVIGTAEKIPPSELVDTTGAGDAFIAAVLYSLCTQMNLEKMLAFGAIVAGANCRALGARGGLPYYHDSKLISFLDAL